jgi:hypothetical protein
VGGLRFGACIGIDEIRTHEFCAMLIIAEDQDLPDCGRLPRSEWLKTI